MYSLALISKLSSKGSRVISLPYFNDRAVEMNLSASSGFFAKREPWK